MQGEGIKRLFQKHGIKSTVNRQSVYQVLLDRQEPLSAEMIYQHMMAQGGGVNLSTIYRTLDTFTQKGLVIKTVLSLEDRATYEINHHEHRHHLLCVNCGGVEPIKGCPLEAYEKELVEQTGYTILEHKLEILGICPKCQK
ncbi:Fur family transcriptional regulator [Fusibacter sp. JL298sf-3]